MDYSWNSSLSIPRDGDLAMPPTSSPVVKASFASEKLTIGAGVAIFHIASARVVVCEHRGYCFLPKGRRNANEETGRAAVREGFEESGYRNRLLPLPLVHRQPDPDEGHVQFVTEPVWTQMLPQSTTAQYLLFWYAAETISPEDEQIIAQGDNVTGTDGRRLYTDPPPYPTALSIRERIAQDQDVGRTGEQKVYEPVWHEGTGVDQEEQQYKSFLLPIDEAKKRLRGSIMEDVIRIAWDAILLRRTIEDRAS